MPDVIVGVLLYGEYVVSSILCLKSDILAGTLCSSSSISKRSAAVKDIITRSSGLRKVKAY